MEYFHEKSQKKKNFIYHRLGTKFKYAKLMIWGDTLELLVTSYSEMSSRGYPKVRTPDLVLVSHHP